ncbi:MAG: hypothetical protein A3I44_06390 [Candidatus Sungbacteria bacterium RIFCSPLOWO2_02_FULL_51_17]|nr:MAG: hypothetical protein A2676_04860 [Candidatus Sungbacteria bacterium RIFCSPHIGHO2_01_FULL_51_22]OHA05225.1 MAG: hypothetical protein A3B29_00095 [Candidatus Sungbacteria bacterium RIFCSPLOWO2_01_FULL_51_34]OHA11120.1 MAG: hypothetical protein A3I44_06390 [Candidatus Sungbacteria bacterium RIFCSPLOWO2_02_FULL_51_17]
MRDAMDHTLDNLFESMAKAKLLRLFVMNPEACFSLHEIGKQTQIKRISAKKELGKLLKLHFIKKKVIFVKDAIKKRAWREQVFFADPQFKFFPELKSLIMKASPADKTELTKRLNAVGGIKFAAVAGVFINSDNSRADLLVVGDKIPRKKFRRFLARTESEIGKELTYMMLTPQEFRYRLDMYDRFLRDVLEFPHQKLINRMNV